MLLACLCIFMPERADAPLSGIWATLAGIVLLVCLGDEVRRQVVEKGTDDALRLSEISQLGSSDSSSIHPIVVSVLFFSFLDLAVDFELGNFFFSLDEEGMKQ